MKSGSKVQLVGGATSVPLQSYITKHPSFTNKILSAASHFVVASGGAARVVFALAGVVLALAVVVLAPGPGLSGKGGEG